MDSCTELSSPHFEINLSKTVQKLLTFYVSVEKQTGSEHGRSDPGITLLSCTTVYIYYSIYLTPYWTINSSREESMFVATTISSIILHIDNEDKEQLLMSVTVLSQCILTN